MIVVVTPGAEDTPPRANGRDAGWTTEVESAPRQETATDPTATRTSRPARTVIGRTFTRAPLVPRLGPSPLAVVTLPTMGGRVWFPPCPPTVTNR